MAKQFVFQKNQEKKSDKEFLCSEKQGQKLNYEYKYIQAEIGGQV